MEVRRPPRFAGTLFGAFFFLLGLFLFVLMVGSPISERIRMQSWQPMQAKVIEADLQSRRDDEGTLIYKAVATYRYRHAGREYQGHRISLHQGSDSFGSYQEDRYRQLASAANYNRTVRGWVNPDNPRASVLDRGLRWKLVLFPGLLCSVFILIGAGVLYFTWTRKAPVDPAIRDKRPWQARSEWSPEGIYSKNRFTIAMWWIVTLLVHTVTLPMLTALPGELHKGNYASLAMLLFVAAGLFCLFKAVKKTIEHRRFGPVPVVLDPFPGQIGGRVAGFLKFSRRLGHAVDFEVKLKHMRTTTRRGTDGDRETNIDCLWELASRGKVRVSAGSSLVYFAFAVPEQMSSSRIEDGDGYWWSLEARGRMQGVDFHREYEIPVFRVGGTPPAHKASEVELVHGKTDFTEELEALLDIEQRDGGLVIRQPAGKQKLAKPLTLFGLLFGSIGIGVTFTDAPILFPLVFGGFGLLLTGIGINLMITGYETIIGSDRIVHRTLRLGREQKRVDWPRAQVHGLRLSRSGSGGEGGKAVEYFDLLLQRINGVTVKVSAGIGGRLAAAQLLESLAMLTGLKARDEYLSAKPRKPERQQA
nr:DUF3592 domain-containing protein [Microbulbifer yueqingensis]